MPDALLLDRVLSLPAADIKALQEGKTIAALPISQVPRGWKFILYPRFESESLTNVKLETWAACEGFKMIHEAEQLSVLSALTLWSQSELKKLFEERGHLSLVLLRVYRLPQPIAILGAATSEIRLGKFIGLSHFGEAFKESVRVTEILPILSETVFANRHRKITSFRPPEHPALEALQDTISRYAQNYPAAKALDNDLRIFLGWADCQEAISAHQTHNWMKAITSYGYRTDEAIENKKSNHQAGTDFEIIIRQSLEFLGFKVDEAHQGGAGGIDIFCSQPYQLVGECKSGKGIPDNTVEQLDRIAKRHLEEKYESAHRFIIGPGEASPNLIKSAAFSRIAIMKPETLQKLVEFHNHYPISLLELRDKCLVAGQVDDKVEEFLAELISRIRLQSHIVITLKQYLQDRDLKEIGFERYCGVFDPSQPSTIS